MTFVIAYLRDIGFKYSWVAESFETSCPWANVSALTRNVEAVIRKECSDRGFGDRVWVTFRVP